MIQVPDECLQNASECTTVYRPEPETYKYFELASCEGPKFAPNESTDGNINCFYDWLLHECLAELYVLCWVFLLLWSKVINRKCKGVYGVMQVYPYSFWFWNYPASIEILWLARWIINKHQVDHLFRKKHDSGGKASPESCPAACSNFQWCVEIANGI